MDVLHNYIYPHSFTIGTYMLLAVFFIGGIVNFVKWEKTRDFIESKDIAVDSGVVVLVSSVWQIVGATLCLLVPYRTYGCGLLILFTLVSSSLFYQFWRMTGLERHVNQILFLANMGVAGGLFLLMHHFIAY